ncbi:hypothetical protein LG276_00930 [Cytobacillus kochii]|uniref:hypothetical protein n=1 Tax=Cytobacillus kochii TaxID=859143 RepID=UPI00384CE551
MKKLSCLYISALLIFSLVQVEAKAETNTEIIPQDQPPSIMELAFLRSLGETIIKAMDEKGDQQLYTSARIERISRNIENDSFDIELRVVGYEGPINPPYKLIRITLRIPGESNSNYEIKAYSSKFISVKEFYKLSKNTGY